jgi:hypothetical protein
MIKKDSADNNKTGIAKVGLSGDVDLRFVSKRADRNFIPTAQENEGQRPGARSKQDNFLSKLMLYDMVFGLGILQKNSRDITENSGWSLTNLLHLRSMDYLSQKGLLDKDDIVMADTGNAAVSDMKVLRVSGENGQPDTYLTGPAMEKFLKSIQGKSYSNVEGTTVGALQHRMITGTLERVDLSGQVGLNPLLAKRMEKDPQIAGYVSYAMQAAERAGIDPTLYANQLWQESRFNSRAVSGAGARGISQMMPFHEGKFGLSSKEDFFDPYKSMDAGAKMMAGLTRQYGDQRLALVAYNGGGKAIDFVEKSLGRAEVSFEQWHQFMASRREQLGSAVRGAWHVETLGYVNNIAAAPVAEKTPGMKWADQHMTVQPS